MQAPFECGATRHLPRAGRHRDGKIPGSVARALLQGDEELRRAAAEAMANDPIEGHAMLKEGATLPDILLRRAVVHGLGTCRTTLGDRNTSAHAGGR